MATKQQGEQRRDEERQERDVLQAQIRERVLRTLGAPSDLREVQVRLLWEAHYRVNVLTGADVVSTRIAHSYFLKADGHGNIVESTPKIAKQY